MRQNLYLRGLLLRGEGKGERKGERKGKGKGRKRKGESTQGRDDGRVGREGCRGL